MTIDPVTGTVGTPIPIGSEPTVMAETSDGNYLYVGLSGANSLAQFDLLHQSLKATIPFRPYTIRDGNQRGRYLAGRHARQLIRHWQ